MYGGTSIRPGELFSGAGFGNKGISLHNGVRGTSIGPGEFFSGADFGNIGKSFITLKEPDPGWGNFFSRGQPSNTNEG